MNGFEKEVAAFHDALSRAYEKGFQDGADSARDKVLAAISGVRPANLDPATSEVSPNSDEPAALATPEKNVGGKRTRAPRGLPKALTIRVLKSSPQGVTPQQIIDAAETDFEKMIAVSSIRSELRKGEAEDRYVEVDGVWHLADSDEAGGHTSKGTPPASNFSHERKTDAPSVTSNVWD